MRLDVVLLVFGMTLTTVFAPAHGAEDRPLVLATGEIHGYFYPIGGAICRAVTKAANGATCLVRPTGGSTENLGLLLTEAVDLAIIQSRVLFEAGRGTKKGATTARGEAEAEPTTELRGLLALHDEAAVLLVRKKAAINKPEDLKGKRLAIGQTGSFARQMTDLMLEAIGLDHDDLGNALEIEPGRLARAFCADEVDGAVFAGVHPMREAARAIAECGAVPLGLSEGLLDDLTQANPFLYRVAFEPGFYEGIKQPVATFATRAILVSMTRLDDAGAQAVVKAVADNAEALGMYHPAFRRLTRKTMAQINAIVPVHPGAERFFQE